MTSDLISRLKEREEFINTVDTALASPITPEQKLVIIARALQTLSMQDRKRVQGGQDGMELGLSS